MYKTKNVILAVMDGARWSETFGDPTKTICPHLHNDLALLGVNFTNCLNTGQTITRQGHSTIISGTWQRMQLQGPRLNMPSLFEYFRDETGAPAASCWSVFGKGLYAFEQPSSHPGYGVNYGGFQVHGDRPFAPFHEGSQSGDVYVTNEVFECMERYQPRILFINWGHPDCAGHRTRAGIEQYQRAVRNCDEQFWRLWTFVQEHPAYRDCTTVVFLNDHGRAGDNWSRHGTGHPECAHCICLWIGPDTPKGVSVGRAVYLTDIAPTCAELLSIQTPLATGKVLPEVFTTCREINAFKAITGTARRAVVIERQARRADLEQTVAQYALDHYKAGEVPDNFGGELLVTGFERLTRDPAVPTALRRDLRQYVRRWIRMNPGGSLGGHSDVFISGLCGKQIEKLCQFGEYETISKAAPEAPRDADSMGLLRAALAVAQSRSRRGSPLEEAAIVNLFSMALHKRERYPWHPLDNAEWCYHLAKLNYLVGLSEPCSAIRDHLFDCIVVLLEMNPEVGMLWSDPLLSAIYCAVVKFGLMCYSSGNNEVWRLLHEKARAHFRAGKRVDAKLGVSGYMVTRHIRIISRRGAQHMVERLRYLVEPSGKFADGSPMAQGAFLTVFNVEPWRYAGTHPYVQRIDPDTEDDTRATAPWEVVEE